MIGTENIKLAESSDGTFHPEAFMNSNSLLVVNLKLSGPFPVQEMLRKGVLKRKEMGEKATMYSYKLVKGESRFRVI